jgi:hypothetical protein
MVIIKHEIARERLSYAKLQQARSAMSQMHDAASESASIGPRGVLFHLARRWRMILFCWFAVSLALVFGVFHLVEPMFKASATLEVKPPGRVPISVLDPVTGEDVPGVSTNVEVYSILSDRVLDEALADPGTSQLPLIKHATDPKSDVRPELAGPRPYRLRPGKFHRRLGSPDGDVPGGQAKYVLATQHVPPEWHRFRGTVCPE